MPRANDAGGEIGLGGRLAFAAFVIALGFVALGVPWDRSSKARGGVGISADPSRISATNCCKTFNGEPMRNGFCLLDANPDAGISEPGEYLLVEGGTQVCTFALAPESRFDVIERDDSPRSDDSGPADDFDRRAAEER